MRYFTDSPFERLMMQVPQYQKEPQSKPDPPKAHPCHGCKRIGESCALPCYRGIEVKPSAPAQNRSRSR